MLAAASWWQHVPWQAIGAALGIITLGIGGMKLAAMFGGMTQTDKDHERRITSLEGKSDAVPERIDAEISVQTAAVESQEALLRANVAKMSRQFRVLNAVVGPLYARCTQLNGPLSQVVSMDEIRIGKSTDEEELRLTPPKGLKQP